MNTPIFDQISRYLESGPLRLHMPGHKGTGPLGSEARDVTELDDLDVLYHETGILQESQKNASLLFGSKKTLYSTEGSTLSIHAMLYLAKLYFGSDLRIAADRGAHKAFLTGCALLDLDPIWLTSEGNTLFSGAVSPEMLRDFFQSSPARPQIVFVTSPDYLGNVADIAALVRICHENGALLFVDNAHGAYLQFLPESMHPLALGADVVCDSAHKTLPVLTGGAYLHISHGAPDFFAEMAPRAMALFASSSPSYLILQSLDLCNRYLDSQFPGLLYDFCGKAYDLKKQLQKQGFLLPSQEPLKITLLTKAYGYRGEELAQILQENGLWCEFSDADHIVLMLTPQNGVDSLERIRKIFDLIPQRDPILAFPPKIPQPKAVLSPREALFSPTERLPVSACCGRILGSVSVSCPPAIPIAICGERLTEEHLAAFSYYGIAEIEVVK